MSADPIVAADRALNELVDLAAQLAVLTSNEIVPLPPVVLLRITSIVTGMEASLFTLIHWVDVAATLSAESPSGTAPEPKHGS